MKIYTSKLGLKFSIVNMSIPSKDEVVYFTRSEFDWIKSKNLSPEEFRFLWLAKKENHNYEICPKDMLNNKELALRYCDEILASLGPKYSENINKKDSLQGEEESI